MYRTVRYLVSFQDVILSKAILIGVSKQKVIKNSTGLGFCYGKALIKIGHKILIANPDQSERYL